MKQQDIVTLFGYAKDHYNFTIDEAQRATGVAIETVRYVLGNANKDQRYFKEIPQGENKPAQYVMTIEGHLFLLSYWSLTEARANANRALYIAIVALAVTVLVGIAQIAVQLNISPPIAIWNLGIPFYAFPGLP